VFEALSSSSSDEGLLEALYNHDSLVIVSAMVGNFIADRPDSFPDLQGRIYGPDTSPQGGVRDDKGKPIGTKGLIRYF
jgi:hypothetical protein